MCDSTLRCEDARSSRGFLGPFFCLIAEVCSWIPAGKLSHSLMFLQDPRVSWCPGHSLRTSNMVEGGGCALVNLSSHWGSQLTSGITEDPHGPWQNSVGSMLLAVELTTQSPPQQSPVGTLEVWSEQ